MGGSLAEAVAGVAVVVLAIIGLTGIAPMYLAPIATIVAGVALMLEGASVAARRMQAFEDTDRSAQSEASGGLGAEVLAGIAGVVLGILALIGLMPLTLMSVAILVFGTGLLLAGAVKSSFCGTEQCCSHVAREAVLAAASSQAMVGLASVVLGILSLVSVGTGTPVANAMNLILVALLILGVAITMAGLAIGGRMACMMRHE